MVKAGIDHDGYTALVRVNGGVLSAHIYQDEILRHHIVPPVNFTGGLFQHDNTRPHTVPVCQDFLQQNNIQVLPWPARSADLSPIEHLWDHRFHHRNPLPQTLLELFLALQNEWQNIPHCPIQNIVILYRQ